MKEELETKLRRCQVNLSDAGLGVIAFGAWSIVRVAVMLIIVPQNFNLQNMDSLTLAIFWIILALVLVFEIALRLIIGLSARKEGRGKKRGYVYLVLCIFYVLLSITAQIYSFSSTDSISYIIASYLFEIGSDAILIDVVICSIKTKKLKKQLLLIEGKE